MKFGQRLGALTDLVLGSWFNSATPASTATESSVQAPVYTLKLEDVEGFEGLSQEELDAIEAAESNEDAKRVAEEDMLKEEGILSGKQGSSGGPGAGKPFGGRLRDKIKREAEGKCTYCGKTTTKKDGPRKDNTDHIFPKSRGGNNTKENADHTCQTCNLQKTDRTKQEFLDDLKNGERLKSLDKD